MHCYWKSFTRGPIISHLKKNWVPINTDSWTIIDTNLDLISRWFFNSYFSLLVQFIHYIAGSIYIFRFWFNLYFSFLVHRMFFFHSMNVTIRSSGTWPHIFGAFHFVYTQVHTSQWWFIYVCLKQFHFICGSWIIL